MDSLGWSFVSRYVYYIIVTLIWSQCFDRCSSSGQCDHALHSGNLAIGDPSVTPGRQFNSEMEVRYHPFAISRSRQKVPEELDDE